MRLIDADAFEKSVMFGDAEDMQDVIYALRDYPITYDIDKVVEQLKTDSSVRLYGSGNSNNYLILLEKAIEIVKAGAASVDREHIRSDVGESAIKNHIMQMFMRKE